MYSHRSSFVVIIGLMITCFGFVTPQVHASTRAVGLAQHASQQAGTGLDVVNTIGGATNAVTVSGTYAYLGEGTALNLFDVSNPAVPIQVGRVLLPGIVSAITVAGPFAYIAASGFGLQIVDVSNPAAPAIRGHYDGIGRTTGVSVAGAVAAVSSNLGVFFLDVTTPSAPLLQSHYPSPANNVQIVGTLAYVAGQYSYRDNQEGTFDIIDIHNLKQPTLLSSTSFNDREPEVNDVFVVDGLAYVLTSQVLVLWIGGLYVVDVHNPAKPVTHDSLHFDPNVIATSVSVDHKTAYIGEPSWNGQPGAFDIIDVSDPDHLQLLKNSHIEDIADVYIAGHSAYLAADGLHVLDVSDNRNPKQQTFVESAGFAVNIDIVDTTAYLIDTYGLEIYNLSDVANPVHVGSLPISDTNDITVRDALAYVTTSYGLHIVDVSDPASPHLVGATNRGRGPVRLAGQFAYMLDSYFSPNLAIVDVSDPSSPTIRGVFNQDLGTIRGLDVVDNRVYIVAAYGVTTDIETTSFGQLSVIDVSNPDAPGLMSTLTYEGDAEGIVVQNNLAYIGGKPGLTVVDVSNPNAPLLQAQLPIASSSYSGARLFDIANGTAYLGDTNLIAVDVHTPSQPKIYGHVPMPADVTDMQMHDDFAYVATGAAGLRLMRVDPALLSSPIFLPLVFQ